MVPRFPSLIRAVALAGCTLLALSTPSRAQSPEEKEAAAVTPESLSFLGAYQLPTGLKVAGIEFGGLSAIDRDPDTGLYLALSDDRSEKGAARFYTLAIAADAEGIHGVDIRGVTALLSPLGAPYLPGEVDPEALRLGPAGDRVYWASERDPNGMPYAGEMALTGAQMRAFTLPNRYARVRNNLSFESLTIDAEGTHAVLATENAMDGDGPAATLEAGSLSRVLEVALVSGLPKREFTYRTDPIPETPEPPDGYADNGLVDLLAKPDGSFYALERSYAVGKGNVIKLFSTTLDGATDVLATDRLAGADVTPMPKTLLMELGAGRSDVEPDNVEGLSWGPTLEDGRKTLLMVSDNNFNEGQVTQFLLYAIDP